MPRLCGDRYGCKRVAQRTSTCALACAQQVASQIVPDLVWNPKLENMQTLIIENILKELNAENEARQGPQGPLRFKFVGICGVPFDDEAVYHTARRCNDCCVSFSRIAAQVLLMHAHAIGTTQPTVCALPPSTSRRDSLTCCSGPSFAILLPTRAIHFLTAFGHSA
eukprot:scaffold83913_cov40-Tisochrysis_lutea.AAC.1